ncbi:MAG: hypothetical protein ACOCWR_07020, partial [Oceanidesulfovibrio sp.]
SRKILQYMQCKNKPLRAYFVNHDKTYMKDTADMAQPRAPRTIQDAAAASWPPGITVPWRP